MTWRFLKFCWMFSLKSQWVRRVLRCQGAREEEGRLVPELQKSDDQR